MPDAEREIALPEPVDLAPTLTFLRRGRGDPTLHTADGLAAWQEVWRAQRTPAGAATLRLRVIDGPPTLAARLHVAAWGPGAVWSLERAGDQLGERAPGPAPEGLTVMPDGEGWRRIPDHDWHRAGVGPQRMATIRRVAAVAPALQRTLALGRGGPEAVAALCSIPGVGSWTAAEVVQRAHGDPDTVSVGDAHLPHVIGTWFTGDRTDDAGMLALLAPFAGHRQRVVRLITSLSVEAPRFGAKATIEDHRAR